MLVSSTVCVLVSPPTVLNTPGIFPCSAGVAGGGGWEGGVTVTLDFRWQWEPAIQIFCQTDQQFAPQALTMAQPNIYRGTNS